MLKILKKIKFDDKENRMSKVGATEDVIKNYKQGKNKNLDYLLSKRFSWMNNFIRSSDVGLEVGAGAGLSKKFIFNEKFPDGEREWNTDNIPDLSDEEKEKWK